MKTVAIIIITSLVWVGTAFARLNTTPTDDDSLLKLPPKLELLNSSFFPADSGLYVKYNFMSTFENMDSFWMEYSHTGIFDFSLFYFEFLIIINLQYSNNKLLLLIVYKLFFKNSIIIFTNF